MKPANESSDSHRSGKALKAFGILAAVLVVAAVLHSQTSGASVRSAIETIDKDNPSMSGPGGAASLRSEGSILGCIDSLNKQMTSEDGGSKLEGVPVTEDAVYSFTDEAGNAKEVEWQAGVASRGRDLEIGLPHQVAEEDDGTFKLLYGDKTVVMAAVDGCKVAGLYEATPSGQINPRVSAGFEEDAQEAAGEDDEKAEDPEPEPEMGEDIAFGTAPRSTSRFPFTVRVGSPGRGGRPGRGFCSGEIISSYYVVTSKHCTRGKAHNGLEIVAGATLVGRGYRQIRRSNYIWRHPREDIALVRVSRRFGYNRLVNKVPRFASYSRRGLVFASGYGAVKKPGGMSNRFKYASMYVQSNLFCKRHRRSFAIGKEVCCRGGSGNTCGGDSGGPMGFYRKGKYNLLGINSWSVTSCSNKRGNVDVFESMAYLHKWVLGTMGRHYGWTSVVLHRSGLCTQARWRKRGRFYKFAGRRRVRC